MANELAPHQAWQQLYELYHAMPDEELLQLAASPDDLTDIARDVLDRELTVRHLEPPKPDTAPAAPASAWWSPAGDSASQDDPPRKTPGEVALRTFYDAFDARRACEFLEEAELGFELRDVSSPDSGMRSFSGEPPVALRILVQGSDLQRAMSVLREKMGLFPLQEVALADTPIDDGTPATLGSFGRRSDADETARALDDARIWHRIVANPDGTEETEDLYLLEINQADLPKAIAAVERSLDLPEE